MHLIIAYWTLSYHHPLKLFYFFHWVQDEKLRTMIYLNFVWILHFLCMSPILYGKHIDVCFKTVFQMKYLFMYLSLFYCSAISETDSHLSKPRAHWASAMIYLMKRNTVLPLLFLFYVFIRKPLDCAALASTAMTCWGIISSIWLTSPNIHWHFAFVFLGELHLWPFLFI